jgi:transglutaminase-like putative cysteine protease
MHVLRSARTWREDRTTYPDLLSLYVLNITGWLAIGLLVVAWVLPVRSAGGILVSTWESLTSPIVEPLNDLSRVFAAIDGQRGGPVHKFGSTLPLQGEVSLGRSEVSQVTTTEPGFLRAQTYAEYTPQGWKAGESRVTAADWPAARPLQDPEEAVLQFRRPLSIQVTTTKSAGVFLSASSPIALSVESRIVFGPDDSDITSIRPTARLAPGETYRVESTVSAATPERLRASGAVYPDWTSVYLQLPGDLPESVRAKAIEVTQGAANAYDQAAAIEEFLRTYPIDTKIPAAPPKRDSVAYFLFDVQRGYFDYHASAMAVMLRSLGVPARVATGYVIRNQDRVPDSNSYVVTEGHAFTWPEVYFPGLGWVEFNPTPSEALVTRSAVDVAPPPITDITDLDLEGYLGDVGAVASGAASLEIIDDLAAEEEGSKLAGNIILGVIVAFFGITIAGGAAYQLVWQRGMTGLPYADQIWEKTNRLARWARIPSQPHQTPAEFMDTLEDELPEVADMRYIESAFTRSRYGRKELDEAEKERLTGAWRTARKDLIRRIFRRRR